MIFKFVAEMMPAGVLMDSTSSPALFLTRVCLPLFLVKEAKQANMYVQM